MLKIWLHFLGAELIRVKDKIFHLNNRHLFVQASMTDNICTYDKYGVVSYDWSFDFQKLGHVPMLKFVCGVVMFWKLYLSYFFTSVLKLIYKLCLLCIFLLLFRTYKHHFNSAFHWRNGMLRLVKVSLHHAPYKIF